MLSDEKKFADILPDAILVIDTEGRIQWCNLTAQKLLRIKDAPLQAIVIHHLIHFPDIHHFLAQELNQTIASYSLLRPETYLSVTLIHRCEGQNLLLLRDVTHLHYLEQMRQDFVANVSHELRTPLTVIHGYLETLLAQKDIPKQSKKIFTQMYQQSLRMEKLVEDLLLLSRLECHPEELQDKKIVSVAKLIKSICTDAKILSGKCSHLITAEVDENLGLLGNEGELHGAFSNIIFNAVHYTPANGKIHIKWFAENSGGILSVTDTGIGITQEDIPRITERFYRVDKARSRESGGTGLGLAIVKHVLIRHEARLEIESQLGKGSIFSCYFPATRVVTWN